MKNTNLDHPEKLMFQVLSTSSENMSAIASCLFAVALRYILLGSHRAGNHLIFKSLWLVQEWDHASPAPSHTTEPEHKKDLNRGSLFKVQIILPCEIYMSSHCFPHISSLPLHLHIGEKGKEVPTCKGRGGIQQEDPQELWFFCYPAVQSPGEAHSGSQGMNVEPGSLESF